MSCSRTHHGATSGDRTHDLSVLSPTLYNYATALPSFVLVSLKQLLCFYINFVATSQFSCFVLLTYLLVSFLKSFQINEVAMLMPFPGSCGLPVQQGKTSTAVLFACLDIFLLKFFLSI